jgi:hypothetical protein
VSKSRSRSKKKTAAKRAKPRRAAKKTRPLTPGTIELRPIRTQLTANVNALTESIAKSPGTRPELEEALKRMSRFLADIQDICGPDMMIPLA